MHQAPHARARRVRGGRYEDHHPPPSESRPRSRVSRRRLYDQMARALARTEPPGRSASLTRMSLIADLKSLDRSQRSAIWASYLGWTLDAFDYFLMVFMFSAIAREFGTDVKAVSQAVFLTLAARPIGAFVFGWLAERFGRRPVLMADIILFSVLEFASGFAPTLTTLLVLRFLFGIG